MLALNITVFLLSVPEGGLYSLALEEVVCILWAILLSRTHIGFSVM